MIAQIAEGIKQKQGTYTTGLTADAGSNSTTLLDAAVLTSVVNDYYNGWYVVFGGSISMISDYDGGTKTATLQTTLTGFTTGSSYALSQTLLCAYTGYLWRETAKQDVSFPFGTFNIIDDLQNDTFTENMEFSRIQFNLWSKYSSSVADAIAQLDILESALRALYDYVTLTISGWTNTGLRFLSSRPAFSEDDEIVGVIVEYETYIQK